MRVSTSRPAPTEARCADKVAAVSSTPMSTASCARTPPVSRPSSTTMTQTPVCLSPASSARSTGAAPRHRGNNEKCRFTIGTRTSTERGRIVPKATTTPRSMVGSSSGERSWATLSPALVAYWATGVGEGSARRPRRRGSPVTTAATSTPLSTSALRAGTAIWGVPRYTTRRTDDGSGASSTTLIREAEARPRGWGLTRSAPVHATLASPHVVARR